jgi:hypothetical protein
VSNKKKIQADGRTATTPRGIESDDESDTEPSTTRGNQDSIDPGRPTRAPVKDGSRQIRRPQRSLSQVVFDLQPHLQSPPHPPKNTYVYQPLKEDEFRLLIVHPGSPGQEMVCVIVTERLESCQSYQALSYRWGNDDDNKPVKIITWNSPNKTKRTFRDVKVPMLYTRSNLANALQQLRHPRDPVTLYVNALCINHDDQRERFHQSKMTQEIFNKASNVIVWLGPETPASKIAFEFIPKVLDMRGFDKLVKEESNTWDALAELMRNPLFSRRWLIQELAVARKAVLRCGHHTIQWTDFSDAVALFEASLPAIQKYYKFSVATGGPINDIRALGASTLVSVVNNIIRKTPTGEILNRLESVETLVSMLAVFETTDHLEAIVAAMGLAKDRERVEPILDRSRGTLDNYIGFVDYCMQSSRSIDIICRHWAPIIRDKVAPTYCDTCAASKQMQMPSWVPNVSGSAFGAPEDKDKDKQSGRVNGDSFVGLPDCRIYSASAGFEPLIHFDFGRYPHPNVPPFVDRLPYDGTINVEGYSLGPITEFGPRCVKGIIQKECLDLGGWTPHSPTVPERLWRTLVADRGPNNTKPPSWYHRACLHCLEQSGTNGDIDTTAILNQPGGSHIVADFVRRVQSVTWNRKFLLSKAEFNGEKLFGLGPGRARVGDFICILYGCSVPVILREHITEEDHYYEVIGESFIYGLMDGEVREGLSEEDIREKTMTFKLR